MGVPMTILNPLPDARFCGACGHSTDMEGHREDRNKGGAGCKCEVCEIPEDQPLMTIDGKIEGQQDDSEDSEGDSQRAVLNGEPAVPGGGSDLTDQ